MGSGWDVIFSWFGFSLGRFGLIPVVTFKVFLSFVGCLNHPGAYGGLATFTPFGVVLGSFCFSGYHFQDFSELWGVLGPSWGQLGNQIWILDPTSEASAD